MSKCKHIFIIIALLVLLLPGSIYSQKAINFTNLTIDNGLSQATVEAVIQDSSGYIWIGTNDGLNRYNGMEIKTFKSNKKDKESLISSYVTTLAEDKNKNLWVGTDEGISKINLKDYSITNYRYYKDNKDAPYYAILTIYTDKNGNVYMGNNEGVYIYNEENDDFNKILDENNGLSDKNIYSITKDDKDNLWIGTEKGLNKFNEKTKEITTYNDKNIDSHKWGKIYSILFDNENNLWVGTSEEGLKIIDLKDNKVKSFKTNEDDQHSLRSKTIRKIIKDSSGTIWLGTENGLSKYIGEDKFITYANKSYDNTSLVSNVVYTLVEGKSGLIWAGTYTGVSVFDPQDKIETYKNDPFDNNSLSDNVVMGVYEDEEELLWVGTRDKGLNIIDREKGEIKHILAGDDNYSLTTNAISIIRGKDNIIWVGTRNGVNKIDKNTMTIEKYTTQDGLIDNNIKSLLIDSNNRLWIGTPRGVSILDIDSEQILDLTPKLKQHGIKEPYIQEIYEDKNGVFWMGGYISGGLIELNEKQNTIRTYNSISSNDTEEELVVNTIRRIIEDDKGDLWIGTNSGLLKFNKKQGTFEVYTEEDGLSNNIVYEILEDKENNLWMSTNNGISKFNIKDKKFTNLNSSQGLLSNEFNGNSAYKSKEGELIFGCIKGLNIFNPEDILKVNYYPSVVFDSFEVNGKNYSSLDKKVFEYDENFIRIRYFVPDYKNNNRQYYYKLDGNTDDWIPVKNNEVIFTDLKPGKYKFRIKYVTSNGTISKESSLNFTIKSPIWKSPLAIGVYIAVLALIIYNNINKVKRLDRLVYNRTKQLYDEMEKNKILFDKVIDSERSKNNYFINLSHELRTPLNVINSIEQLIRSYCNSDKDITKDKLGNYMDIMRSNTDRLLNLINNIIDTSKIENGKYKLNISENDIVYVVEEATLSLKEAIESLDINLIFDTDVEEKIIKCDKHDIERCIVNLVSNAQKFTPKGGTINVTIEDLDEFVKIIVKDNGCGIDKKYHDTIFDRFNQIVDENSENKGGSGLGLTITKHIIDLHNGKIYIDSEKDKGTKFTIILPIS